MAAVNVKNITKMVHHDRKNICVSRAKYREGRRDTAVKVYTVNQESRYLLIQGIPAVGAGEELKQLCEQYGVVEDYRPIDEYPTEDFTEVYLVKFEWFPAAKTAKKQLDDRSFFGGNLHVCYAPEFETVDETRQKLQERRKYIAFRTKKDALQNKDHVSKVQSTATSVTSQRKSNLNNTKPYVASASERKPITYIWAGKEYTAQPEVPETNSSPPPQSKIQNNSSKPTNISFLPRQLLQKGNKRTLPSAFSSNSSQPSNVENKNVAYQCSLPELQSDSTPESYTMAAEIIREKLKESAAPTMEITFKRKKK